MSPNTHSRVENGSDRRKQCVMEALEKCQMFPNQIIMKNVSLIAVMTAFLACGIALGAHARDTEKIAQQGQVSIEVSNEGELSESVGFPLVSAVPKYLVEVAELLYECTAIARKTCGEGEGSVTIEVEYSADTCAEAAAVVDGVMDKIDCVGFD